MSAPEITRTRIIIESQNLFILKGYSSVLMSEVATNLGISKKTLYRHFSSKEELLLATVDLHRVNMDKKVDEVLENKELEFIEKANRVFQLVGGNLLTVSIEMIIDLMKNAPKAWQKIERDNIEVSYSRITRLLALGTEEGKIREDVNYAIVSLLYMGTVKTMLNPELIAQMPAQLRAEIPTKPSLIFEGLMTIIMKGILK